MPHLDAALLARARAALEPLVRAQCGVFTAAQATATGLTDSHVRTLVRRGTWVVARRGVLAEAAVAARAPHLVACAAKLLRSSHAAVVSHGSAWVLHGLPDLEAPDEPVLTLPWAHGTHPVPGLRLALLPPEHRSTVGGLPVTSAARTLIDVLRTAADRYDAQALADAALRVGGDPEEVERVLAWCAGWPGAAQAREAWRHADGRAESSLESRCRVWFRDGGLPQPLLQVRIGLRRGGSARVDFLFREQRTVVEADGRLQYTDPDVLWKEKRREDGIRDRGLEVVRATWADGADDGADLVQRVLRAFARAATRAA